VSLGLQMNGCLLVFNVLQELVNWVFLLFAWRHCSLLAIGCGLEREMVSSSVFRCQKVRNIHLIVTNSLQKHFMNKIPLVSLGMNLMYRYMKYVCVWNIRLETICNAQPFYWRSVPCIHWCPAISGHNTNGSNTKWWKSSSVLLHGTGATQFPWTSRCSQVLCCGTRSV